MLCAFHSTKDSGLHFRKFPEKRTTSRTIPKFPEISYREFSVQRFAFRKVDNFRVFWKRSQEISVPFVTIRNFRNFWLSRQLPLSLKSLQPYRAHTDSFKSFHLQFSQQSIYAKRARVLLY